MTAYDRSFYLEQMTGSRRSAEIVVPIVMDWLQPKSVIDIGCGVCAWLSMYKKCGVETILGIDGDHDSFQQALQLNPSLQPAREYLLKLS